MAECGTRQSYAEGCRCVDCKAAQAAYRRENKAVNAGVVTNIRQPGRPKNGAVAEVPVLAPGFVGRAEQAVLEELATLTSASTRKGAAQAALALARILDNPQALAQHTAAAKALPDVLDDLRKGSARRKGRLASVQAMTSAKATEKQDA